MKVNFDLSQNTPKFGMAIKVQDTQKGLVKNYLFRQINNIEDTIQLNKYIETQKNNPIDIYLSTTGITNSPQEKLKAVVGGWEIIGKKSLKVIKKAITYANKYNEERIANEAKNSGSSVIITKLLK